LLKQWSSVSVEDALELLSSSYKGSGFSPSLPPGFLLASLIISVITFSLALSSKKGISPVRRYAISRLETADDSELVLYMLQLVQALRYEKGFVDSL